jgi:hypothetical protein
MWRVCMLIVKLIFMELPVISYQGMCDTKVLILDMDLQTY